MLWRELQRKAIHLGFCTAFALFCQQHPDQRLTASLAFLLLLWIYESLRTHRVARAYLNWLGPVLRPHEHLGAWTGATHLLVGCLINALLWGPKAFLLGLWIAGWADAMAALLGKCFQKQGKSWLGSLAFFLVALLICRVHACSWALSITMAALGTWVERSCTAWKLDDNMVLPIVMAGFWECMVFLAALF